MAIGISTLKPAITITEQTVECPCIGCPTVIPRARRGESLRQEKFACPSHEIFISPSTFEYFDERSNLLWDDSADRELLARIKQFKREARLARDNSEDALTWNVVRYMEKSGELAAFLSTVLHTKIQNPTVSYWSYCTATSKTCETLRAARQEFGEQPERSSEPDVIIEADGTLIWIEAKLGSTNETVPSNAADTKRYLSGGDEWFKKAFRNDFATIAIANRRYELMRLWLLGSWAAANTKCKFFLVNLVREAAEETLFASHIAPLPHAHFVCATWEQFYRWALRNVKTGMTDLVLNYMRNKSVGYLNGKLMPAFSIAAERI
jgi:hypothetical protein